MKHISSDNYTIAWFKLAECVSRGERERAFGVYRLLSHSLDDRALALQLEGDLFLAFTMLSESVERYEQAASTYKRSGRLLESASVYEHICTLQPTEMGYKKELAALYSSLQFDTRVADLVCQLVVDYSKAGIFDAARGLVSLINNLDSFAAQVQCYEKVTSLLQSLPGDYQHLCGFYVEHAIKAFIMHGDDILLQKYMNRLKATNDGLYKIAVKTLED